MKLNYLFEAEFEDGTFFKQNKEDRSIIDPQKRSAFYDLLQDTRRIVRFRLLEQKLLKPKELIVDLKQGVFGARNVSPEELYFEGDTDIPLFSLPTNESLRLIFYRQHQHDFKGVTRQEIDHRIIYFIGWQTTIAGKNYQQVVGVK